MFGNRKYFCHFETVTAAKFINLFNLFKHIIIIIIRTIIEWEWLIFVRLCSQFITYVLLIFIKRLIKLNVRRPQWQTAVSLLEDNMTLMANVLLRTKCFIALHSLWCVIQDIINSFGSLFFIRLRELHFRSTLHLVFNYIFILEPDQSVYVLLSSLRESRQFSPSNISKIKLMKQRGEGKERESVYNSLNTFRVISWLSLIHDCCRKLQLYQTSKV